MATIKYDKETTDKLTQLYSIEGKITEEIAKLLEVPERSVIAKLSSLGIYKKKTYLNKQGNPPRKKEDYIASLAELLDVNQDILDSLEKVNKSVLILLEKALEKETT